MTAQPFSHPIRLSELRRAGGAEFDIRPEAEARAAIAEALGLTALRKLRLSGQITPQGRDDWHLEAELGATIVQPCVVTLAPVTTRIDEPVHRRWLKEMPELTGDEVEMLDEEIEPLAAVIDLGTVLVEALALSVPDWPRAADAPEDEFAAETSETTEQPTDRPFAGLGALRDKLTGSEPTDDKPESAHPQSPGKDHPDKG